MFFGGTMPEEGESPSVGWRAVYHEMGVSTVTDPDTLSVDEYYLSRMTISDGQVLADDE